MTIVVGKALDHLGHGSQMEAARSNQYGRSFEARRRSFSLPPSRFATAHPSPVPVDVDHDGRAVGEVRYLEIDGQGSLWAVAEVHTLVPALAQRSWSVVAVRAGANDTYLLDSLALVTSPAMRCLGGLRLVDASRLDRLPPALPLSLVAQGHTHLAGLLQRAADAARTRRRNDPLPLTRRAIDVDPLELPGGLVIDRRSGDALGVIDRSRRPLPRATDPDEDPPPGCGPLRHGPRTRVIAVR